MKCPECSRKMIFDRDIKDYYCEKCKKSLDEIKKPEIEPEKPREPEQQTLVQPPEIGTARGILFMMFGSIIIMINVLLPPECQVIGIIGIFLLIMGFYLVFKDRKNYSNEHIMNIKFAAILVTLWIIINIILLIYRTIIDFNFFDKLGDFDDDDIIPKSIIINYLKELRIIAFISPLVVGLSAIFRYLSIKNLIQPNLKKVLVIIVIISILSGFLIMYSSFDNSQRYIDNLGNITKGELESGDANNSTEISYNYILLYGASFLVITAEAIFILCFYWTYNYLRTKPNNLI